MDKKNQITAVTVRLLENSNIDNITVQKIIDECHISKTTFYKHFKDKYDVANLYFSQQFTDCFKSDSRMEITHNVYNFLYNNHTVLSNAFKSSDTNSLTHHIYNILYDFYKVCWLNTLGISELSKEMHVTLVYHCSGIVSVYKEIVSNKSKYDIDEIANLMFSLESDRFKENTLRENFPKQYK